MTIKNTRQLALIALLALTLGGCAVRVAYHFLDVALLWSLDDYIDFDRGQKAYAKTLIKDFHQWHRYHELPRYVDDLNALADELDGYIDIRIVDRHAATMTDSWLAVMRELGVPAAKLMATLSQEQIDELLKTLEEEEREDLEDYLKETPEDVRQERYDFMSNGVERLTGDLTRDQQALIHKWAAELRDMGQMSLDHRSAWRQRFMTIVEDRSDPARLQREMQDLFGRPYLFWNEGYQQTMDHNQQLTHQLLADLANAMTTRQRQKTTRRLRTVADDFEALSQDPPAGLQPLQAAASSD